MYFSTPNLKELSDYIDDNKLSGNGSILIIIGEECEVSCSEIVSLMNKKKIQFVGGVFPYVIFNQQLSSKGIIFKIARYESIPIYFNSQEDFSLQILDYKINDFETAFVLTTGLSDTVSECLTTLYTYLGNDLKYFGAGVGRTKTSKQGLLLTNEGVYNTGTIVVLSKINPKVDHQHGWNKLTGPFLVTKSEKNIVKEINWENAFKVYKESLRNKLNIEIQQDDYKSVAIHYPFGLYKEERGYIIRDPFSVTSEGYLKCVGNIPENSLIDILCNQKDNNIIIPQRIVENCYECDKRNLKDVLVFDCISRAKHLSADFKYEISTLENQVKKIEPSMNIEGALSYGEICSNGDGYLELLNKSIVFGCIYNE